MLIPWFPKRIIGHDIIQEKTIQLIGINDQVNAFEIAKLHIAHTIVPIRHKEENSKNTFVFFILISLSNSND